MPLFTREYQIDMLLVYEEAIKNRRKAKALYGKRYPDRAQPDDKYFLWFERPLKTERIEEEPNEFVVREEADINTLACIEVDPTTSVRQIAANIEIGRESVRKIFKKHKKPFKYQVHHHLYEADHQRRLEVCGSMYRTISSLCISGNAVQHKKYEDEEEEEEWDGRLSPSPHPAKILTIPEANSAICRETTALRQFDNKLIELRTLNRGRSGMGQKKPPPLCTTGYGCISVLKGCAWVV
ncbi:hypothetical protein NQ318_006262 [Aromia moschata]|uniref:Uncharacterized protein n=1 Tax=Aromia moschata TaxID=1265417 RepID=A0AAV8YY48_9CUCU|nr:hypothetical protein NQ318_006262 [Aromia moschata]